MIAWKIISGLIYTGASGVLWRMGGSESFSLWWRRVGVPLATISYGFGVGLYWQSLIAAGAIFAGSLLPITLIGSHVLWKNVWWVPILGAIYGLSPFMFSLPSWIIGLVLCFVCSLLYSIYIISSELYRLKTGKDIWHIQEYASGATIAGLTAIASLL